MNVKEIMKNKGLGYYVSAAASLAALVMAIIVLATQSWVIPRAAEGGYLIAVPLLVGVVLQVAFTFVPVRFASVLSVISYGIALGITINKVPNAIADYINKVAYTGGDFGMCIFYLVAILLITVAVVVSCFMDQTKDGKTAI
ncbi:MAG TPA: hypothetical protein DDY77_06010 [Clostridiales bacterium]|nr:hypothetical protein [Clostridiales bacterium]